MEMRIHGYGREELMAMDPAILRALLHERTHHTIEVMLYRILDGKLKKPENFGSQAKVLLEIWKQRGLPLDAPDIRWCVKYVALADRLNSGKKVRLGTTLPKRFTAAELRTVRKLIYERRSIRQFTDKPIPERMIREILQAGLMAPQGCNVGSTRFLVLRKPEEWKLVRSDIPVENCVMILVCQDLRIYKALKFDESVPQNLYFDAAAAADHMCLMAHALGLGACWLTHGQESHQRIRDYFGLPETFISRCHIVVGWPDEAPVKSQRMDLDSAMVRRS
jgi:nitroreductase